MDYQEVMSQAKLRMGPYCKTCNVCNGIACRNQMPGPGAKGTGDTAIRNYQKWQEIRVNMDTIVSNFEPDTGIDLFGKHFALPIFAGPVGAVNLHYGDLHTDQTYNDILVKACAENGIAAFTGDGTNPLVMEAATLAIKRTCGIGIPTIKPWNHELVVEKLAMVKDSNAFAVAMDIDAAGLPFLKNMSPPAGAKSAEELTRIISSIDKPFIIKGIMTVSGALKAKEAGASAIVVSNHGGRVLDQCPATAEVLSEIVQAVGKDLKIFVDGGIRTGTDVFKALALGAHAVMIARPFVNAVYGGGEDGVTAYIKKLASELSDTMSMCGAQSISNITKEMIRISL